ncbi:hypothetical protein SNE40_018347 [Patella caerulea]|uniref:Uncharacterized protein n=1 Tax=Patella caerulea TaxID=87958 RepID=A0AAN8P706_PATCE
MIPLSLFNDKVSSLEKKTIADALLSVSSKPPDADSLPKGHFGTGHGKPIFPSNVLEFTNLSDLVNHDSWFLFRLLQLDHDFLNVSVDELSGTTAYQQSLHNINAINVINDFGLAAKSEGHYQNIIQVVEQDRKLTPNLRKRKT